jgi:hypothetical protein
MKIIFRLLIGTLLLCPFGISFINSVDQAPELVLKKSTGINSNADSLLSCKPDRNNSVLAYYKSGQNKRIISVTGKIINNNDPEIWKGYEIDRTLPADLIFKNNVVTSVNASGYMLQAGDENPNAYNSNLEGEIITGNKFIWKGTDNSSITHAIFTGYNINAVIKYNYLLNTPMGLIRKANGMTNTSGGIAYNIVNNPLKLAVAVKGMNNVKIYNNTFYSERTTSETWRPLVHIYSNDNPVAPSTGTKIYNNIFYTRHQIHNITVEADCIAGFECDYNVYWCESGEPIFLVAGKEKTFRQWKEMGYDNHSLVLNPNFINNQDLVPSVLLDFGKDLGDNWKTGLAINATWGSKDPETTDQNTKWQVGAYIRKVTAGKTYFVALNGNDNNPGTYSQPFATWQKGFDSALPGDIVYIRGGTYYPTGISGGDAISGVFVSGKSGNPTSPICIWAYPGETPVLDCRKLDQSKTRFGIYLYDADYWHLKGLSVTRADQVLTGNFGANGVRIYNGNNNIIELLKSYANGGSGITIVYASENNLILNCDAFDNYDKYTQGYNGGHADGIEIADIFERNGNERINYIKGCRSWHNSDDGYDFYKCEGILVIDSCWAWNNGYDKGDGSGFKLGTTEGKAEKDFQRILKNCLSSSNSMMGYDQNGSDAKMKFLNCTSYRNGVFGFNFWTHSVQDILRNNISFQDPNNNFQPDQISDHNSWQNKIKVTRNDFLSFDDTELYNIRKNDGSLPEISFLHLDSGSDLIDAGIDVSMPYSGIAPDIGAFETEFTSFKPGFREIIIFIRGLFLL